MASTQNTKSARLPEKGILNVFFLFLLMHLQLEVESTPRRFTGR